MFSQHINSFPARKADIMSTRMLVERCEESITKALKNPVTMRKYNRIVYTFIDRNNDTMSAPHFGKRLLFDHGPYGEGKETKPIFELIDMDPSPKELTALVKKIKDSGVIFLPPADRSFMWLSAMFLRVREQLPGSVKDKERDLKSIVIYMCFLWWWIVQRKVYPHIPRDEVLNYTVSRLSRKFKIKEHGNALDAVWDSAWSHYLNFKSLLAEGSDDSIKQFITGQWSRINSLFVNFMKETMRDQREGNYMNVDDDHQAVSGDEGHAESELDTYSSEIQQLTSRTTDMLMNKPVNQRLVDLSARISKVSPEGLRDSVAAMTKTFEYDFFYELVNGMLSMYVNDGRNSPNTIYSKHYIVYMLQLYGRSNTTNEFVHEIKNKLDKILRSVSQQYNNTNRKATQVILRKSIFVYVALMVQEANRGMKFSG
jgi:hypothetical protein